MSLLPDRAVIEVDGHEVVMRLVGLPTARFIELWPVLMGDAKFEHIKVYADVVDEFRESWDFDADSAMGVPWQYNAAVARAWISEVGRAPVPLAVRRSGPEPSDAPS